MKIALVHEWLDTYAGSERVLEQLIACFPEADLYALVDFVPEEARGFLAGKAVRTSFIQHLPLARRRFRNYLGLMPLAIEQFDMSGYDVIISSNHAVAKGVITGPDQVHISYMHSPMRYAWDMQAQYLRQAGLERGLKGAYARWLLHRLRNWDARSANGVDIFLANSTYIADRIRKVYRREAVVVHPPVEVDRFAPAASASRTHYLVASRFVPYKRIDLIAQAFSSMPDYKLIIVGEGSEREAVQSAAANSPNIVIKAPVSQSELIHLLQQARAFVFAAEEDFGITMVEAQACGTPVIAFGRGGACDIIVDLDRDQPTGVLFPDQTAMSIINAVEKFESARDQITAEACRRNALYFSQAAFRDKMHDIVDETLKARSGRAKRTASSRPQPAEAALSAAAMPL
jgi:glycosyltransferase involved in cell wall biosynthesis